jgi:hypothetical protein
LIAGSMLSVALPAIVCAQKPRSIDAPGGASSQPGTLVLSRAEYVDRAQAIWMGQMIGQLTGLRFEHTQASVLRDTPLVLGKGAALPDDDYYYEMVALRAFERYGIHLSVEQLGAQWLENNAGTWGSSAQALRLLKQGVKPPDTGNPRYNRVWWTIGSQFSSDIYGALAPGMPNVAAEMARRLGHINGYAEGADGAVFVSGMISLGFVETDSKAIVRKAANLISPLSPYRKCLDQIIAMADEGKQPEEILRAITERWGLEYPATNNAVVNGGIVAVSVWFGHGDFMATENLAFTAADFSDTDCNAANAASVIGAMHGMAAMPKAVVESFQDLVRGDTMGTLALTPPVNEHISTLGARTAAVGEKILLDHGARLQGDTLYIATQQPLTQPAELFQLSDFTKMWNPDWTLERAGYGGVAGIRGDTYLDGDALAVFPRDRVRGALLRRSATLSSQPSLQFDAGADLGHTWHLQVYVDNDKILDRFVDGIVVAPDAPTERVWQHISIDLSAYKGRTVVLRLYDLVIVPNHEVGTSYWRNIVLR